MQGGQVPLWVTLMVAVLGILGVVAGQLINAHREDKRWLREQAREDLRWERERQVRAEDRAHETELYWRDRRLHVYAAFLASISTVRAEMRYASDLLRENGELTQSRHQRLVELVATARDLYAPMGVVGPPEIRAEATGLIRVFARELACLLDGHPVDTTPLLELVRRFAAAARYALGVESDSADARTREWSEPQDDQRHSAATGQADAPGS